LVTTTDATTGTEHTRPVGFSAHYVFAAAQVDGWTPPAEPDRPAAPTDWHDDTDDYFHAIAQVIDTEHSRQPRAYYSPQLDRVHLPDRDTFRSAADYYSTRAHEYGHATGHESRLARTFGKRFGDDAYAAEELTAELTAALVMAQLGRSSEPRPDHAQYLAHWLRVLRADPGHLFHVAGKAERAAAWLADTAARHIEDVRRARTTFAPVTEPDTRQLALV
jgi:antirestriction protein ArdC